LLVKPVNTQELLRQLEALLVSHQDHKALNGRKAAVLDKNKNKGSESAKRAV
jgi:hypothetical protein